MFFGVSGQKQITDGAQEKRSKASVWKEAIEQLVDPSYGMSEEEKSGYEQKIMQKLKMGKKLDAEELEYLRLHCPEMYRSAIRVETERKALQSRLKSCRSKEEVRQVISAQVEVLEAMNGDPDQEYMAAMVKNEVDEFRKSASYARLPERREDGKKQGAGKAEAAEQTGQGLLRDNSIARSVYTQTQIQCESIMQMAEQISAF